MRTNKNRFLTIMVACFGSIVVSSQAHALPLGVTTDDCLGRNLCAFVDTKGHVTCGKCPGQALANPWVIEGRPVGGTYAKIGFGARPPDTAVHAQITAEWMYFLSSVGSRRTSPNLHLTN
jgi:hypothetical protein